MIKLGTQEDVDQVIPLLRRFQEEFSPWTEFSEDKVRQTFDHIIFNGPTPALFAIAMNEEGKPAGLLVALAHESIFNDAIQTQELCFFVAPEERKSKIAVNLFKTYEYWAKNVVEADIMLAGLIDERAGKLYERKGFEFAETIYKKRIN